MLNNVRFLSCSKAATRGRRLTLFLLTRGLVALILYFMTCDQLPSCSMLQWCLPTSSACWCWATILTYGMRQHSTWSSPANCWQRKGYEIFFLKTFKLWICYIFQYFINLCSKLAQNSSNLFFFQDMNNSKLFSDEAANIYERAIGTLLKKNMLLYFSFADYEEVSVRPRNISCKNIFFLQ